jgi:glucose-6-phosphate 1-dehydrogenase
MNPTITATAVDSEPAAILPGMRVRTPLTIAIFGASGDLTQRKLMPALYKMYIHGFLPDEFAILGLARRDWTDASFRDLMCEAIRKFGKTRVDEAKLTAFASRIFYHLGDIESGDVYGALRERLGDTARFPVNHLFYLSVKPDLFGPIIGNLKAHHLIHAPHAGQWTRVVIEKPFGHDLASAVALNQAVRQHLDESQVYRIDHFLGKETVQNILSFRFANAIFEPLFNNHLVDHIQITAAETVGMESGRGAYYDASGAIRDMVQNHMLQLLCLVTMDPPASLTADAIRNEKVKVLQSIVPPRIDEVRRCSIRAQYLHGKLDGKTVKGYREEDRISPNSMTETFLAMRLYIDNWRWAGVPVYLRTGKRLPRRTTEIVVQFKVPPLQLFQTVECVGDVCDLAHAKPNQLVFRIQPDEGISLDFSAKRPVLQVQVESVAMNFSYSNTWQRDLPEAYERLLLDVMRGDSTLFTRSDEVEAAWKIIDPFLKAWATQNNVPMYTYQPGTWGPVEADALLHGIRSQWRNPEEGEQ